MTPRKMGRSNEDESAAMKTRVQQLRQKDTRANGAQQRRLKHSSKDWSPTAGVKPIGGE